MTINSKHIFISAMLFACCLFPGCEWLQAESYCSGYHTEQLKLNETVEIKYGIDYCNPEHEIRLRIDSIEDSRCPLDVLCIWEGNGRVKIQVEQSGTNSVFWLNTLSQFLKDTVIGNLRYELTDLLPYPEVNKEYSLEDYTIHLYISD